MVLGLAALAGAVVFAAANNFFMYRMIRWSGLIAKAPNLLFDWAIIDHKSEPSICLAFIGNGNGTRILSMSEYRNRIVV